jgi:dihydrofolate reductase/thymidylate synthase
MKINLIACIDNQFGIGQSNSIPWHYSKDLRIFRKLTTSSNNELLDIVIMGYNTFISIPKQYRPLKNRLNIILTSKKLKLDNNIIYFDNILSILYYLDNNKDKINIAWIIGGESIYKQFLDLHIVNSIYLTKICNTSFNCDKYFPKDSLKYFKLSECYFDFDYNKKTYSINKDKLQFCLYKYHNKEENKYLETINKILCKGIHKIDRTQVGTISLFGKSFKYNIRNYRLPLFTHRKMFYRGIIEELLFFLSGNTNTKILENKNVNIWKGNTSREFLDSRNLNHLDEGDMGAGYSFQLRHFGAKYINSNTDYTNQGFDQLEYVIDLIKNNPNSRRILFSYWNPSDLNNVALPSCFLKNTLVLTKNGYQYIQNIKLNDLVYTHKGNWKPINNIQYKIYNNDIYKIICKYNNKSIKTTKEHPFYIVDYTLSNNLDYKILSSEPYWCTAEKLNCNNHLLCMPINKNNILYKLNLNDNLKEITLDQSYILGFCLHNSYISINKKYYIHISKSNLYLYDRLNLHLHLSLHKENNNYKSYIINNKEWFSILNEFGNKVYNKKIPEWIQDLPKLYIIQFLSGINDALNIKNNKIYYKILSYSLALSIQRLYSKLKIFVSIKYNNDKIRNYSRYKYELQVIENYQLIDDNFIYYQIEQITKNNKRIDVYNFEVADDNSYIVQNITVHNCHILYQFHVNNITNELSCSFYQRSSDFVLAANFNIVSAAILTFMLCHITGYKPGKVIHNIGDIHIYNTHIEESKKLLNNNPYNFPILHIEDPEKQITNITDFKYEHFKILLYQSYKKYNFKMAI